MADHAKPILTDNYTNVLSQIRGRFEDQAKGFDPANTTATNIVTGTIRWNSAENKFQKWSGTAWGDLTTNYVLSSITLSTGTPNGVAYLNGSKVLTTGSALTFDGTVFTASADASATTIEVFKASNVGSGDNTQASFGFYAAGTKYAEIIGGYAGAPALKYNATTIIGYHQWQINTTEQMRLTSTGLGIGTSSPAYKLDVNGTGRIGTAIFDSSGNLGLGVTPSAWGPNFSVMQLKGQYGGALSTSSVANTSTNLSHGAYHNGTNWVYGATGFGAARYEIDAPTGGATHKWYTAPSGTAGNAISFTQVMTLDANGKLILSAANQGIQFADGTTQTTAASSGTYTPTITLNALGTSVSPNSAFIYTKVGNIVTVYGQVFFSKTTNNSVSGTLSISLPINKPTNGQVRGVAQTNATTFVSGPPSFYGTAFGLTFTLPPSSATAATISLFAAPTTNNSFWLADVSFSYSVI